MIIPYEREPEGKPIFNSDSKKFEWSSTEPMTGIQTKFELDPKKQTRYWYDILPFGTTRVIVIQDRLPKRNIEVGYAATTSDFSEQVSMKTNRFTESLDLELHTQSDEFYESIALKYSPSGHLKTLDVSSERFGNNPEEENILSKFLHFENRNLDENIQELSQIFAATGVSLFQYDPDQDFQMSDILEYSKEDIEDEMAKKAWSKETKDAANNQLVSMTSSLLERFDDSNTGEQRSLLVQLIEAAAIEHLEDRFDYELDSRELLIIDAIQKAVSGILVEYNFKLNNSSITPSFRLYDRNLHNLGFRVWDQNRNIVNSEYVEYGQKIRYEGSDYTLEPAQNGNLSLTVARIVEPQFTTTWQIPDTRDFATIRKILSSTHNSGWEEVFKHMEIEHHSVRS